MKTRKPLPDAEFLRDLFLYDPATGVLRWLKRGMGRRDTVGWVTKKGYLSVEISDSAFLVHNIIWKMVTGRDPLPGHIVDHRDTDKLNNRWDNFREATNSQNSFNKKMRSDNTTGLKGVTAPNKWGRYQATITVKGKRRSLGFFTNPADAHAAYVAASKSDHGEFARVK